jgi:hypothetical protein
MTGSSWRTVVLHSSIAPGQSRHPEDEKRNELIND